MALCRGELGDSANKMSQKISNSNSRIKWFFLILCEKCPLIELSSGCKYEAFCSNSAVCHLFGTFCVSQAKSDRPIKALENTSLMAFTQIEEEPIFLG